MTEDIVTLLVLALLLMVYAQVAQDRIVRDLKRSQQTMGDLLGHLAVKAGMHVEVTDEHHLKISEHAHD